MSRVYRAPVIPLLVLLLGGCGTVPLEELYAGNRSRLQRLSVGMTQQTAMQIMLVMGIRTPGTGWRVTNPHRTEQYRDGDHRVVVLYYLTDPPREVAPYADAQGLVFEESQMTPLVFRDGRLLGWQREFWHQFRAGRLLERIAQP